MIFNHDTLKPPVIAKHILHTLDDNVNTQSIYSASEKHFNSLVMDK